MTEKQADYITEAKEALEMLGAGYEPSAEIEQPRTVTERREGKLVEVERQAFVKLYTSFKKELEDIEGDELRVWLYLSLSINRYTKTAEPGLRHIADKLKLAVNTVRGIVDRLEAKGLLDVEKKDGKRNVYRPADYVSVSKFDTVTVSKNDGTVSKNDGTVSVARRENAQLEELESTRKGDLVDGLLFYGKKAVERKEDKVEELIHEIERGLRVNITRTNANQNAARRILKDGRPFGQWLTWCISDEWRAAHLYIYADLDKMWQIYPQAFEKTSGQNPQGLEIGL